MKFSVLLVWFFFMAYRIPLTSSPLVQGLPGRCTKVFGEMCKGAKVKSTSSLEFDKRKQFNKWIQREGMIDPQRAK